MIYDIDLNLITDESTIDLSIGRIITIQRVKPGVEPVDDIAKFEYTQEELEDIQVYIVDRRKKYRKERENKPTDTDRLEARLAYIEMMTGLMEV